MSIVDALPWEWKRIIRQSAQHPPSHIGDACYLKMEDSEEALSKVSSKLLYVAFKSRKQVTPTAQKKFQEKFPQLQTDWREKLFRLKMIDSPLCTFCKREIESIEHLFFFCDVTMIFWEALCSWLSNYKIGVQPFTLIGVFNIADDFSVINHLTLTAKLYIYKSKLNNIHPNLRVYKAKIKTVYLVEKTIARRRNK